MVEPNHRLASIRAEVAKLNAREWELRGAPAEERFPIWKLRKALMADELAELARLAREKVGANV